MTGWQISCPTCGARFDVSYLKTFADPRGRAFDVTAACPACGCCACATCRTSPIVAARNELERVRVEVRR